MFSRRGGATFNTDLLRTLAQVTADPIGLFRVEGPESFRHVWFDERSTGLTGLRPSDVVGKLISETMPAEVVRRFHSYANEAVTTRKPVRYIAAPELPNPEITLEITMAPIFDDKGCDYLLATIRDVSDRAAAEAERDAALARLRRLMENAADLVWLVGADGRIKYVTPAIERILGFSPEELIEGDPFKLLAPEDIPMMQDFFMSLVAGDGEPKRNEIRVLHRDGSKRWVDLIASNLLGDPSVGAIVVNARDITERHLAEEQLTYLAHHDPLTGLYNRVLLNQRLAEVAARAVPPDRLTAVLFVDFDGFKLINDSLGHDRGDQLIIEAATRLREVVGDRGWIARLSGDEFIIIVEDLGTIEHHKRLAADVKTVLSCPYQLADRQVYLTVSVGVAAGAAEWPTPVDTLLRNADMAMYAAKRLRSTEPRVFDQSMAEATEQRLEAMSLLQQATQREEFVLYFQPIVSLPDRRVIGAEALIRWRHPKRGIVGPFEFIPIAEESDLIIPIGEWVMNNACRQVRTWVDAGFGRLSVAINVSPRQLADPRFQQRLEASIARAGIDPALLVLEITENLIVDDPRAARELLQRIETLGVRCAIDDFGTGYSSLAYLPEFPVHILKIDRGFLQGIEDPAEQQRRTIVGTIISMAHALDRSVIAEGVERPEQMEALVNLGCESAQGFYFGRPVPADEFTALLERSATPRARGVTARTR